jgi:hypothetical protein
MRKSLSLMLATALVMGTTMTANAALLYYEGFDYAAGPPSAPWQRNFGGTETSMFVAGSLSYPGLPATGGRLEQNDPGGGGFPYTTNANTPGTNTVLSTAGTYYITMLGRVQGEEGGLDGLGGPTLHGSPDFGGGYIRPVIQYLGEGQGQIRVELNGTGEPASGGFPVNVDSGHATLIAMRVTNTGGAGSLVQVAVDPAGLIEPNWDGGDTIVSASTNFNTPVNANGSIVMNRDHAWDEFRIGTNWGDVVPEPASLTLLGLGGLALLRRRR